MRLTLIALALLSACGSDFGASADLAVSDLSVGDLAAADLASDCPAVAPGAVGNFGPCTRPDAYCGFFEESCHCNVQSQSWYCCWTGQRQLCPATPPSGPDCCVTYVPDQCSYACTGGVATVCNCTDDAWHCTTMPCD